MTEQANSILTGWSDIDVGEFERFALVRAIDPGGTERVAHAARADVAAAALLAQYEAEEEANEAARIEAAMFTPPALVSDQPSTQEQASAPPSAEAAVPSGEAGGGAAYAGTMLQEDRENYLRGVITVRVTQIEQNRLAGRYDANARERQRVGFVEFHNASDLGLPITDEVRAAYDEFLAADAWVRATKDHADALRAAAITVGLELLEAMQTSVEEGWP